MLRKTVSSVNRGTFDPEDQAWKVFIRYRHIATGLLMLMGGMTFLGYVCLSYGIVRNGFWIGLVIAGSQAGFIGGCADWFAVTALFRHPMGLPVPHTAILPRQQKKLGYGLGWFIARYIFTEQDIALILNKLDLPTVLANYLVDPETVKMIRMFLLKSVPHLLDRFEDGKAGDILTRILYRLLSGESISPLVGRILRVMVDNAQHHDVISLVLEILKKTLKDKEQSLRDMIHNRVREQGGRFLGWMIGDSIATKVLVAVNKEMDRIDPHNEAVREKISQWFRTEIDKIEKNQGRMDKISEALKLFVNHEGVQEWRDNLWQRFRQLIEEDAANGQGWFKNIIEDSIQYFADQFQHDPRIREKLNAVVTMMLVKALPHMQNWLINFTETVVAGWDSKDLVQRLECRVGKDLQYIRINGSVIGFLIGMVLYLLIHLCFHGQAVFII